MCGADIAVFSGFLAVLYGDWRVCSVQPCLRAHSELSPSRAEPGADTPEVDQLAHQECLRVIATGIPTSPGPRASSFLPQAGDPAQCRHGHHPAAATKADDAGPAHLQRCDHSRPWPHLYLPSAACQPHPHPHPVLPFSGEFQPPSTMAPQPCFSEPMPPKPALLPFLLSCGPQPLPDCAPKGGQSRSCGHKAAEPPNQGPQAAGQRHEQVWAPLCHWRPDLLTAGVW